MSPVFLLLTIVTLEPEQFPVHLPCCLLALGFRDCRDAAPSAEPFGLRQPSAAFGRRDRRGGKLDWIKESAFWTKLQERIGKAIPVYPASNPLVE